MKQSLTNMLTVKLLRTNSWPKTWTGKVPALSYGILVFPCSLFSQRTPSTFYRGGTLWEATPWLSLAWGPCLCPSWPRSWASLSPSFSDLKRLNLIGLIGGITLESPQRALVASSVSGLGIASEIRLTDFLVFVLRISLGYPAFSKLSEPCFISCRIWKGMITDLAWYFLKNMTLQHVSRIKVLALFSSWHVFVS